MIPEKLPCLARLDAVENAIASLIDGMADIRRSQRDHAELIDLRAREAARVVKDEAKTQRDAVRAEGELIAAQFAQQGASLLAVSSALNTMQASLTKWGAGGALAGAVLLFIAVRALGF